MNEFGVREREKRNYISAIAGLAGAGLSFAGSQQASKTAGKPLQPTTIPLPEYAKAGQRVVSRALLSNLDAERPTFADFVNSGGNARMKISRPNLTPAEAMGIGMVTPQGGPVPYYDPRTQTGLTPEQSYLYSMNNPDSRDVNSSKFSPRMNALAEAYDKARRFATEYNRSTEGGKTGQRSGEFQRKSEKWGSRYRDLLANWNSQDYLYPGPKDSKNPNPYLRDDPRHEKFIQRRKAYAAAMKAYNEAKNKDSGGIMSHLGMNPFTPGFNPMTGEVGF